MLPLDLLDFFPWLALVPAPLLQRLDTSELIWPDSSLLDTCAALERHLPAHIIPCRAAAQQSPPPGKLHLYTLIEPAALDSGALALLAEQEARVRHLGVRLVAYSRPLRLQRQR